VTVPRSKCIVLVPVGSAIEPECDVALRSLEARGYPVRRSFGCSAIDQARSRLATDALAGDWEELLWIDSDVCFEPDAVEQLRSHELPIACGIYPRKGLAAVACLPLAGTTQLVFGEGGGLVEICYAGAGFLLTRRSVYETMKTRLELPDCEGPRPIVPYFLPMCAMLEGKPRYLAEDFSFCHRARQCGFRVMADTRIRLWHIGRYRYGWEDALGPRERFASLRLPTPAGSGS
jgi:hypothetical protein